MLKFTPYANSFYFSPTGRYLLCITRYGWDSNAKSSSITLTLIDLITDERKVFWLENTLAAAEVIWSEDDSRIFFTAEKGLPGAFFLFYQPGAIITNHLIVYEFNLKKSLFTVHMDLPDLEGVIYPSVFNESENTLTLTKTMYATYDIHETLVLDLATNELVLPVKTPSP
jgi:hypothetical protein